MRKVRASIIAFHPIEFFSQKYSKKVFFVSTQITLECEICWCFKHRIWNIQNLPVSFHHFLLNSESAPQSYDHLNIFDGTFVQFCDYVVLPERYIYIYIYISGKWMNTQEWRYSTGVVTICATDLLEQL